MRVGGDDNGGNQLLFVYTFILKDLGNDLFFSLQPTKDAELMKVSSRHHGFRRDLPSRKHKRFDRRLACCEPTDGRRSRLYDTDKQIGFKRIYKQPPRKWGLLCFGRIGEDHGDEALRKSVQTIQRSSARICIFAFLPARRPMECPISTRLFATSPIGRLTGLTVGDFSSPGSRQNTPRSFRS